jgi:MSHA biogenesis protein MshG
MASVESGSSLSEAMMKYRKVFNELYVNMVKAGEVSGLLDEVLERLAEFGERELDNRTKIKTATRYPLITLVALFFAFVIVVTFVIPKFANIFSQFKANLPLPTKILLATSTFMQRFWYIVVLVVVALAFLFLRYVNTKRGRPQWDYVKLRIPLFGPIISMLVMSRFARTMSILIRSGLPILQVLDMVSRTVGNAAVSRTVDEIAANVREGKSISAPMGLSKLFPPIVVQMVAVGEDTGKIDELLMKVSEYYDQQSDYSMKNLSTMIEPVFVLILGVMVLIMALAIFLPMWNLASVVIKH